MLFRDLFEFLSESLLCIQLLRGIPSRSFVLDIRNGLAVLLGFVDLLLGEPLVFLESLRELLLGLCELLLGLCEPLLGPRSFCSLSLELFDFNLDTGSRRTF